MNFPSIRLEGSILSADLLDAVAREDKHGQKPADFGLNSSGKVKDEIATTWASAKALWTGYQAKVTNLREDQTGVTETRSLFIIPLLSLLGYQPEKAEAETLNGKSYAISHRDPSRDGFPIHIMGWNDSLEKKRNAGGPRVSAHALVQEYLNLTEHLYGLITNGRQLRLLRDSSRLIKLSFLEFDLVRIFQEDLYADFALLFRLLHATRMPANRNNASGSVIEKYHQDSVDSGSRIRDGLAAAVAYSMQTVANGLLAHPANASLVEQLRQDSARVTELHQNLLRWVYRTLFVLVIEERVLHHEPTATLRQRQLYRDFYSLQRLRRLADRPQLADRRAYDLWRAMHQTLRLYEDGGKGLPLGIAPLGSFLFREEGLRTLFQYQLDNRSFLQALNRLSTFTHPDSNVRMRVNYGALDVEEFGSVYESLLELRPRIIPEGEKLTFSYAQLAGSERKTTGSYYTPDSLVQCLLDSALDPVVEDRLKGKFGADAEKALLSIKVCDPAVGSGHFLIGAAHRLARRLAEIRAGEEALSPDVQRHALRDVVSHCLYGVDINPLSVELCKVSLWMLGMEPGKPLSFLDHHIWCGNSLIGATPELVAEGIPDDAFKPIEGDDKKACAELKKRNKAERKGLGVLFAKEDAAAREKLQKAVSAIDEISDDSPEAIQRKEAAFKNAQQNYDFQKAQDLADLWCAAFVIKKHFVGGAISDGVDIVPASGETSTPEDQPLATQGGLFGGLEELPKPTSKKPSARTTSQGSVGAPFGVTTQHLRDFVEGGELPVGLYEEIKRLAGEYQFFHWHLVLPEVFGQGGFDVILGNPPWERLKLAQDEFFASSRPDIANATTSSLREPMIEALQVEDPPLYRLYLNAVRKADCVSQMVRTSGKYPLCGHGDVNMYALFAELNRSIIAPWGRLGCVLQAGIATDKTTSLFFEDIVTRRNLVSFIAFDNKDRLFPAVKTSTRFCLLVISASNVSPSLPVTFVFYARNIEEAFDPRRQFTLTPEEIVLLNPNTKTCPVFLSRRDADLVTAIYRRIPILVHDESDANPWGLIIRRLFDMNDKDNLAKCAEQPTSIDGVPMPVYEAKLIEQFGHLQQTYENGGAREVTSEEKSSPYSSVSPRRWLSDYHVRESVPEFWKRRWLLAWQNVTDTNTMARTVISAIIPLSASDFTLRLGFPQADPVLGGIAFVSVFNSFIFDYVTRQKLGGVNLSDYIVKQLPMLAPTTFASSFSFTGGDLRQWIMPRVLELTYTAWDLEAFAQDCGWSGPPFRWDEERRFQLRCELDAAFFHLYGLNRDDTAYILDTFPIVKRKDEEKFGTYRTKETILALYDALAECQRNGKPFVSPLNPPPADSRCCHPPKK